jgi:hypothetical protein
MAPRRHGKGGAGRFYKSSTNEEAVVTVMISVWDVAADELVYNLFISSE